MSSLVAALLGMTDAPFLERSRSVARSTRATDLVHTHTTLRCVIPELRP
jgi:hypothetical protein